MTSSEIILGSILPASLASAGVAWLFRAWIGTRLKEAIKSEYDLKLEAVKADLKRDNDVYMEQLKSKYEEAKQLQSHNLELARMERQIRFSGSYQEVLKATEEVHAKLMDIRMALQDYTSAFEFSEMPSKGVRREKLTVLVRDFQTLFNAKRIYFPATLDEEISDYIQAIWHTCIQFMCRVEQGEKSGKSGEWVKIIEKVDGLWNVAHASILLQFRSILGIEELAAMNKPVMPQTA